MSYAEPSAGGIGGVNILVRRVGVCTLYLMESDDCVCMWRCVMLCESVLI